MKRIFWFGFKMISVSVLINFATITSYADTLKGYQLEDKQAVKDANISQAEKLNSSGITHEEKKQEAEEIANIVNQVPGVKVTAKDLEPPEQPPIKGFHPIKRLLRPVENLEGMSIKLEQQIMKLEGPIAALQPPMVNLQKKMNGVDSHLEDTNNTLGKMEYRLHSVEDQVKGARTDIDSVRQEINALKEPITGLRGPLGTIAKPLEAVQTQLNLVLLAILFTAVVIAIGTPIAAIQVYRNRHKIFPDLGDHELPK